MADSKISALPTISTVDGDELIPLCDDPGGTPATKAISTSDLLAGTVQSVVAGTNVTVDDTDPANPVVSATGGGGGGSAHESVDDPDSWSADIGYDYEFDGSGSTLPSGWSWVNQGSATYQEGLGAGLVTVPASGTDNIRGIVQAWPSESTWTLTAKIGAELASSNYALASVGVRDATSGRLVLFSLESTSQTVLQQWTNLTTWNANVSPAGSRRDVPRQYFRIVKNSATSYDFLVSADGVAWWQHVTGYDLSGWLSAPSQIGFFGNSQNSVRVTVACHWFRIR